MKKYRRIIFVLFIITICSAQQFQGGIDDGTPCPVSPDQLDVDSLVQTPPEPYNINCLTIELAEKFLKIREHVVGVVDCLEDFTDCRAKGYELIADDILFNINAAGRCEGCTVDNTKMVEYIVRGISGLYPDLYKRGLSAIA